MDIDAFSHKQGFRVSRRLPNGVVVWRAEFGRGRRHRRAVRDGEIVASFSEPAPGCPATGHVDGNFALVQGRHAPVRQYRDWETALRGL